MLYRGLTQAGLGFAELKGEITA
ncbi:hypothetical protein NITGR_20019 [Nitrospina gracilis 3/211]|uniref:Uncharacterized protein n=1 Tax=Nitrospina gracilis (strain 3/211) TaxID=1266370 RepID=M1YWW1_NITG3|nr:hypothetical protein NITGR_20019 [Nitrospina gracilis 3/211]